MVTEVPGFFFFFFSLVLFAIIKKGTYVQYIHVQYIRLNPVKTAGIGSKEPTSHLARLIVLIHPVNSNNDVLYLRIK